MTLELESVTVLRRGRAIVKDASLAVAAGEVVVILGPNGAGKSTLLGVATGEIVPDRGAVLLAGRSLESWTIGERARRRAVLQQSTSVAFDFTVLEVVLLGRTPHHGGRETARDTRIAREALSLVGVSELENRLTSTLSGGEAQLVHLARVLGQVWEKPALGERVLLLDEPTSSLDLYFQRRVLSAARRFAERGVAVLCVLHDLNLAAGAADRVVVLRQGSVVAQGTPQRTLTSELVASVYGVECLVLSHPERDIPLIVPLEAEGAARSSPELFAS